jgi:ATP adenylyltransferase
LAGPMQTLLTPWRFAYISEYELVPEGCFFCSATEHPEDPERLVVAVAEHHIVMVNRYPYTNGHLMVAPLIHLASPADSTMEAVEEFWPLVLNCQRVLERAYDPDGFNMGMNLGNAAGAGVPGHYHFHIVPRWSGDTNFMSVVAGTRLVPEEPEQVRERLVALFEEEGR